MPNKYEKLYSTNFDCQANAINPSSNQPSGAEWSQMASSSSSRLAMATRDQTDEFQESQSQLKVDRKLFEKLNKLSEKILKYCQSERMNLVNSPPYIIDILPDMCQLLNAIHAAYESRLHVLNDIEYFSVFSTNLLEKLLKIVDLFKQAGKSIVVISSFCFNFFGLLSVLDA